MAALGTGAALGARYSWNRNRDADMPDRFKASGTGALYGIGAAAALGIGAAYRLDKPIVSSASGLYKAAMWNPVKSFMARKGNPMGIGAGIPKGKGGTIGMLAMLAGGIGAIAYGAASQEQPVAGYAYEENGTYSSTRQRLDMMGADGNVVFGLNNMRHG